MEVEFDPIHTDEDYEAALDEAHALMDAGPGTPDGQRLDLLVTRIEAYEAKHWNIGPVDAEGLSD